MTDLWDDRMPALPLSSQQVWEGRPPSPNAPSEKTAARQAVREEGGAAKPWRVGIGSLWKKKGRAWLGRGPDAGRFAVWWAVRYRK